MPQKRISIQQIANHAQVSRSTVSRALRNDPKISEKTRSRIHRIARQLNYCPDPEISQLMRHLRFAGESVSLMPIAFVTCFPSPEEWKNSPSILKCYEGARSRARQHGYDLQHFWLGDKEMSEARLGEILYHRGIRGVLIAPLPDGLSSMQMQWDRFAAVTIGYSLAEPAISRASSHFAHAMRIALAALELRGYRRIGLFMPGGDRRLDHGYLSEYLLRDQRIASRDRVPILESDRYSSDEYAKWKAKSKPEVVVTTNAETAKRLSSEKKAIRSDLAILNLDGSTPERYSGVEHHTPDIGAAAVDLIVEQLHLRQFGIPKAPKAVLVECEWIDGQSARMLPPKTSPKNA